MSLDWIFDGCDVNPKASSCPWVKDCRSAVGQTCSSKGLSKSLSLFTEHAAPWSNPVMGDPGIAGLGVLISFTVTAVLCAIYCKFYQFLLLWPMRKRDPKTGNKTSGHKFPILTGASLSLQGSLLFLGYALFGAAHIKRCQLTTYHVKLLSKLFIVIFSSVFNSAMSTAYICLKSWGRENRGLRRVRVSLIVRCVSAVALVALLATSVLFLASTETPKFNQPAMAVPGYCFAKKYFEIKSQVEDLIGHNYTDLILGLVAMVSAIAYFILAILKNQRRMKAETPGSRWILRFATVILIALNLGYNTVILVRLWNEWQGAQAYLAKNTSEKEWGFGQIVPVIMLINPILSLLDALTGSNEYWSTVQGDWARRRNFNEQDAELGSISSSPNQSSHSSRHRSSSGETNSAHLDDDGYQEQLGYELDRRELDRPAEVLQDGSEIPEAEGA